MSKKSMSKTKTILNHMRQRKGFAIATAIFTFLLLSTGICMRGRFVAEMDLQIGRVNYLSDSGLIRFELFEPLRDTENFVLNAVLGRAYPQLEGRCSAEGTVLDHPAFKITCKGWSEEKALAYVNLIAEAIIKRHEKAFLTAQAIRKARADARGRKIKNLEKSIASLKARSGRDSESESRKLELERELAAAQITKFEESVLKEPVLKTEAIADSVFVINRTPTVWTWLFAFVLSLLVGFVSSFLLSINGLCEEEGKRK